jgi:hypothetical protein
VVSEGAHDSGIGQLCSSNLCGFKHLEASKLTKAYGPNNLEKLCEECGGVRGQGFKPRSHLTSDQGQLQDQQHVVNDHLLLNDQGVPCPAKWVTLI